MSEMIRNDTIVNASRMSCDGYFWKCCIRVLCMIKLTFSAIKSTEGGRAVGRSVHVNYLEMTGRAVGRTVHVNYLEMALP